MLKTGSKPYSQAPAEYFITCSMVTWERAGYFFSCDSLQQKKKRMKLNSFTVTWFSISRSVTIQTKHKQNLTLLSGTNYTRVSFPGIYGRALIVCRHSAWGSEQKEWRHQVVVGMTIVHKALSLYVHSWLNNAQNAAYIFSDVPTMSHLCEPGPPIYHTANNRKLDGSQETRL